MTRAELRAWADSPLQDRNPIALAVRELFEAFRFLAARQPGALTEYAVYVDELADARAEAAGLAKLADDLRAETRRLRAEAAKQPPLWREADETE